MDGSLGKDCAVIQKKSFARHRFLNYYDFVWLNFPKLSEPEEAIMSERAMKVRVNYVAILVAALVNFILQACWYLTFMNTWLAGIGHTKQWIMTTGMNEWVQHGTAFVSAFLIAGSIDCLTQLTGKQTAMRGILMGLSLWVGFVLTTMATDYIYEVRPLSLFAVNCGFWLIGMVVMGAIVGAWKKK
jgi:hypothetical protein